MVLALLASTSEGGVRVWTGEDVELTTTEAVAATGLRSIRLVRLCAAGTITSYKPGDSSRLGWRLSAKSLYDWLLTLKYDRGHKAAMLLAYVDELRNRGLARPYPPHAG